jgi:hypothetical protein
MPVNIGVGKILNTCLAASSAGLREIWGWYAGVCNMGYCTMWRGIIRLAQHLIADIFKSHAVENK